MADDRALQLTLTGEKYSDGSTINIAYAEERSDPDLIEQFSPEGSGCTRTFYCKWNARFAFIDSVLGFAKVNESGTDGVSSTATFNGKHIHRRLPIGYHMGCTTVIGSDGVGSGDYSNWVYATRAVAMPDGEKTNDADGSLTYSPKSDWAKILVTFTALEYDIGGADSAIYQTGASPSGPYIVDGMREWERFTRPIQKPTSQFYQFPGHCLKLIDYPSAGQTLGPIRPQEVLEESADFWLYCYDLPMDPIQGIRRVFGRVNKFACFPTADNTAGQPAETLHFVAADIQRLPLRMGRKYWNCQLGFRKTMHKDTTDTVRGWNHVRYASPDGNHFSLRLFRASADGTSSLAAGNPLYDVDDFLKIWWID